MWRRYKLVRQNDGNDCGAAALATLALHHRLSVGLERLRELTATDRSGATLLGLRQAAERIGFSAAAVRCPYDSLEQLPLPAIAHLTDQQGNGHFVVIYKLTQRGLVVADPIGKVGELSRESFCRQWTGALLVATPDVTADACRRRSDQEGGSWARFSKLVRPHRAILAEVVACALLMTVLSVATSYFVQHLVDSVLVRRESSLLNALGVGMVCIALFRALFDALRQYLLAYVGRRLDLALMSRYMRHVLGLPMRFFETRRAGEILARMNDAAKLREAVSGSVTTAVVDALVVIGLLGVLWLYDVQLAAATTVVAPVFLAAIVLNHKAARSRSQDAMENGAQLSAHLIEDVGAVDTIKALGAESRRCEQGESKLVSFAQSLFDLRKLDIRVGAISTLITGLAVIGVLWYGGHRVMAGALSIGQLLFFYTLLATMLEPLSRLSTVNLKLQEALVAVERLFQVLDVQPEAPEADKAPLHRIERGLELVDASFSYGARGVVLDRINLQVPAGSTVAVVGESGSGKSTLLKLLQGLYEPTAGRVLVDGADLRDLDLADYRRRIGVVSQDPFIFNGTIRQNLAIARPDATLAEIVSAARAAGLEDFINSLPQRYDTMLGERGANLSGGQRQRLAIARALLREPDVLIFDEATSHLDTATERAIQANLRTALAGKTVVLVAHRLSTIKDADNIYLLHEGRVAEEGSHATLLAAGGRYAALWKAQITDAELPGRSSRPLPRLSSEMAWAGQQRFNGSPEPISY